MMTTNADANADLPADLLAKPSEEQRRVIEAGSGKDVLVVAGAGSGKTFTMTRRIISLITEGHVPPSRILGLTFTRAAAAELLSRVSAAIDGKLANEPGRKAMEGSRIESMVMKPRVSTYDAFFQSIIAQYGALIGMDPRTQPLSDAGSIQMVSDIVSKHIDDLFESGAIASDERDADGDPSDESSADDSDTGSLQDVVRQIRALSSTIADSVIGTGCPTVEQAVAAIDEWDRGFLDVLRSLRNGDDPRPDPTVDPDLAPPVFTSSAEKKMDFEEWLARDGVTRKGMNPKITPFRNAVVDHLIVVTNRRQQLLPLVLEYADEKRQRRMAEFSDFTIAALRLVTRFPSIGAEYRRRYTHVLLDEYQDTSTAQAALLAGLFHQGPDRRSAVTAVGDPYQSIYSWRGASPGAFRQFIDHFHPEEGQRYGLTESRRNPPVVLDAANRLTAAFNRSYSPDTSVPRDSREVPVAPLQPVSAHPKKSDADGSNPTTALPPFCGVMGFGTRREEARAVAVFARRAVDGIRAAASESDASSTEGRRPPVAVLFRSRGRMDVFADALSKQRLHCQVIGNTPLAGRPDIADVLALLKAESDHTDPHPLLGLLASPRFGMDAHDLRALAGLADDANVDYQFRCLVQAGLASEAAGSSRADRRRIVREHRQDVDLPAGMFLADAVLAPDLEKRMEFSGLSVRGRDIVLRLARMLRTVEDAGRVSVPDAVRAAADVLDVDADDAVSDALRSEGSEGYESTWRDALDVLLDQVDSYTREITSGQPSVLGFVQWFDSLERQPDGPATGIDESADVLLMTIHQAKGLEWPAVAVVGVEEGTFPSSQGDRLSIAIPKDVDWKDPDWNRTGGPAYLSTSRCWLDDPADVPAPVRADYGILPRFPHRGTVADIHDLDTLEHETFDAIYTGNGRRRSGAGDYAGQHEEYGRRRHEDERRLVYVALTRASREVLVTYSAGKTASWSGKPGADVLRPVDPDARGGRVTHPSVFWRELFEAWKPRTHDESQGDGDDDGCVTPLDGAVAAAVGKVVDTTSPDGPQNDGDDEGRLRFADLLPSDAAAPIGFVRRLRGSDDEGDAADEKDSQAFIDGLLGDIAVNDLSSIIEQARESQEGPSASWPGDVAKRTRDILGMTADVVRDALRRAGDGAESAKNRPDASSATSSAQMPLSKRAEELSEAADTVKASANVLARANEVRRGMNLGTTALERTLAAGNDERGSRELALSILRPMPHAPSAVADRGTRFHEWAASFLGAALDDEIGDRPAMPDERASILAEMGTDDSLDDREKEWRRRLADSVWAWRRPVAVEASITAVLDGMPVNGRLDSVFAGGFDPRHPDAMPDDADGRYVIVDWKTGRRPRKAEEKRNRLVQLDVYRLLLSIQLGIPLGNVDATLCYVDCEFRGDRYVPAEPRDEEEILQEIRKGRYLPENSESEESPDITLA